MVVYGDTQSFARLYIELPSTEAILCDSLRWENMDAFTPEDINDINNSYYKEKEEKETREAEWEKQREKAMQSQEAFEKELFASVGLQPDGRPTLACMMEQAQYLGLARGLSMGLDGPDSLKAEEEDRRLHEYWKYGIYGKEGLKKRQRELKEREPELRIQLQPIGPVGR